MNQRPGTGKPPRTSCQASQRGPSPSANQRTNERTSGCSSGFRLLHPGHPRSVSSVGLFTRGLSHSPPRDESRPRATVNVTAQAQVASVSSWENTCAAAFWEEMWRMRPAHLDMAWARAPVAAPTRTCPPTAYPLRGDRWAQSAGHDDGMRRKRARRSQCSLGGA